MTLSCRLSLCILLTLLPSFAVGQNTSFRFAVSGDSRNCGDIVMPSIAKSAIQQRAQFYWHLGDLRAIYDFDQDIVRRRDRSSPLAIADYERIAWDDFIEHQLAPFGRLPVFIGIGNHEVYPPKSREQFIIQFADWLDAPALREQRLKDDPADHRLKAYFHWKMGPVDFIYLDDATSDQFDTAQLKWLEQVLQRDQSDTSIRSIVVGMHAALPDSLASGHSMNDWPAGEQSGRRVYQDLLKAHTEGHRNVYALASHSHFYMAGIFDSDYMHAHGGVIPGWIVGTAGAVRYALPPGAKQAQAAMTNVYGYLLGTVNADGSVKFEFQEVKEADVPPAVAAQYPAEVVHECYAGNSVAH